MAKNEILLDRLFKAHNSRMVFDIGANVGQTVADIRKQLPRVTIHTFEPVRASFEALQYAVRNDINTTAHQLAFGKEPGTALITSNATSTANKIVTDEAGKVPTEEVRVTTGDDFCRTNGIPSIDFLKIDVEGLELDVLIGFRDMLAGQKVEFVQLECGLSPRNKYHVPLSELSSIMWSFGYGLHGLYDTSREMGPVGRSAAKLFGNAVFVRDEMLLTSQELRAERRMKKATKHAA